MSDFIVYTNAFISHARSCTNCISFGIPLWIPIPHVARTIVAMYDKGE